MGNATEHPTPTRAILRGLARRCPWCGQVKLFRGWFRMAESCPRCGLRLEREEGAFLGSLALNYGVTGIVFIAWLVVWLVLTLPDPPLLTLTLSSAALVILLPLFLYPFAKPTWTALDLVLRGMDRGR